MVSRWSLFEVWSRNGVLGGWQSLDITHAHSCPISSIIGRLLPSPGSVQEHFSDSCVTRQSAITSGYAVIQDLVAPCSARFSSEGAPPLFRFHKRYRSAESRIGTNLRQFGCGFKPNHAWHMQLHSLTEQFKCAILLARCKKCSHKLHVQS